MTIIRNPRHPVTDRSRLVRSLQDIGAVTAHSQTAVYAQTAGSAAISDAVDVAAGKTLTVDDDTTISGGGTLALGGFTATIPATGTVAMVETACVLLDADVTALTISNDATEQTLYSFSVPGGTLGTANKLRLVLNGSFLNNTGGNAAPTIKVKYGATTIYNDVGTNQASAATQHPWRIECELSAANATNAQTALGLTYMGPTSLLAGVSNGTNVIRSGLHTAVAEDSTSAKTLAVTVTLPSASASLTFTCYSVHLELLRK